MLPPLGRNVCPCAKLIVFDNSNGIVLFVHKPSEKEFFPRDTAAGFPVSLIFVLTMKSPNPTYKLKTLSRRLLPTHRPMIHIIMHYYTTFALKKTILSNSTNARLNIQRNPRQNACARRDRCVAERREEKKSFHFNEVLAQGDQLAPRMTKLTTRICELHAMCLQEE